MQRHPVRHPLVPGGVRILRGPGAGQPLPAQPAPDPEPPQAARRGDVQHGDEDLGQEGERLHTDF